MPEIQTFPWTFLIFFMLMPLLLVGAFLWFATSMFRRAASDPDRYGLQPFEDDGRSDPYETSESYGGGYEAPRRQRDSEWRSFSWGPGLKTMLIILGVSALITLVLAPRFFPGVILFLPLFWVGGWGRTFRLGNGRRSGDDQRSRQEPIQQDRR